MSQSNKEKIMILADDSEVIQKAYSFFKEHSFIDLIWKSLNSSIEINKGDYSLILISLEPNEDSYELAFKHMDKIRKIDKETTLIVITSDDNIVMDQRIIAYGVDDLILSPFKIGLFGYKILINLSRHRRFKNSCCVLHAKHKYTEQLDKVKHTLQGILNEGLNITDDSRKNQQN